MIEREDEALYYKFCEFVTIACTYSLYFAVYFMFTLYIIILWAPCGFSIYNLYVFFGLIIKLTCARLAPIPLRAPISVDDDTQVVVMFAIKV